MIYVIRHGRTDWNEQGRLQGGTDIPLNDLGKQQAEEAAVLCRDIHFDAVFCSPLVRAKETADILLRGKNISVNYDERLREMNFGDYEGTVEADRPKDCSMTVLFDHPENYVADGNAESLEHLFTRTGEFLREKALPLHREGKSVLIVGHGAMNNSIVTQLKGLPISKMWGGYKNCQLVMVLDDKTPVPEALSRKL